MKRLALSLAVLTIVGLATNVASAGHGYPGYYRPYPVYGAPAYPYYQSWGPSYSVNSHEEAVRRIQAAHSRYRYYSHPRSMYNSPPTQFDYFGWGYAY